MTDHDQRSMRGRQDYIIAARLYALNWLLGVYAFNEREVGRLAGSSDWFCAIHCYIGGDRYGGLRFLFRAASYLGFGVSGVILAMKIVLGRNIVERIFRRGVAL